MSPRVSVIVPTYNRAYVLGRALESACAQTYRDHEIVVVDDGSDDDTRELVASFHERGVRYLTHSGNQGVSAARNTAIRAARGELLAFLDSDDVLAPSMIEQLVAFLDDHPGIDAVFSDVAVVEGVDAVPVVASLARELPVFSRLLAVLAADVPVLVDKRAMYLCLLEEVPVKPSALLVRARVFEKIGYFDEHLKSGEDWDWLMRLVRITDFGFVNRPLVRQHRLPDATHRVMREADKLGIIQLLSRERARAATDPDARAAATRGLVAAASNLGWHYRTTGRRRRAAAAYLRGAALTRDLGLVARAAIALVPFDISLLTGRGRTRGA